MKTTQTLLVIVDVQNDFVTGSLGTPEALAAVPKMVEFAQENFDRGAQIAFTQDTHYEETYMDTQEGKNLPVLHCIKGTEGHDIIDELKPFLTQKKMIVEKETFGSNKLVDLVGDMINNKHIKEVVLMGLCTDICVISNLILLKTQFPEVPISIYEPGCAGVTPEQHDAAIHVMGSSLQANIIKE